MTRKGHRKLSAEERALWHKVAESATPLGPRAATHAPLSAKAKPKKPAPQPLREFRIGATAQTAPPRLDTGLNLGDELASAPVKMDRRAFQNMNRGKLKPEARIDLHGMTMDQAHPRLMRFILTAHASGKRLVLVITGKGRKPRDEGPIPVRHGILRHQVPQWLSQPPLSQAVLQITQSHQRHGGEGAYYVYLRRHR